MGRPSLKFYISEMFSI